MVRGGWDRGYVRVGVGLGVLGAAAAADRLFDGLCADPAGDWSLPPEAHRPTPTPRPTVTANAPPASACLCCTFRAGARCLC
jgi:hypothetical protein